LIDSCSSNKAQNWRK